MARTEAIVGLFATLLVLHHTQLSSNFSLKARRDTLDLISRGLGDIEKGQRNPGSPAETQAKSSESEASEARFDSEKIFMEAMHNIKCMVVNCPPEGVEGSPPANETTTTTTTTTTITPEVSSSTPVPESTSTSSTTTQSTTTSGTRPDETTSP